MTDSSRTIAKNLDNALVNDVEPDDDAPAAATEGKRYLEIADPGDPWANYDPEKARTALRKVAGLFTPEEAHRLVENVYRGREVRNTDRRNLAGL